jgi:hypothetical protein
MWVERTDEELRKWRQRAERSARQSGLFMASAVCLAVSAMMAGGWIASAQFVVIANSSQAEGSFWSRFLLFVVILSPFGWWLYRHESKRHLAKALAQTICPKCEIAAETDAGLPCECGGSFVPLSTVKWEEAEEVKDGSVQA